MDPDTTPNTTAPESWAALSGRWSFTEGVVRYLGPGEAEAPPYGLAVSSAKLRSGVVSARVILTRNQRTTAGIVFGYRNPNTSYFIAQLGAYNRAYSMSEYSPGQGWTALTYAGSLQNLPVGVPIEMTLQVVSQYATFEVNSVRVLDFILPRPLEGTGVGLFGWDDAEISFQDITIRTEQPRLFVMMPFSEPYDTIYEEVIQPVSKELGFTVTRVDEGQGPGIILEDIQQEIRRAHAVVAEISSHNPNVFYELGYAHALGKPAVLLVRRQDQRDMPFDVRAYRAIFYDDTIGGKKMVEARLREHLRAVLRSTGDSS